MELKIKALPEEVVVAGKTQISLTRFCVFYGERRIGTILKATENGETDWTAEQCWTAECGRPKAAMLRGSTEVLKFESLRSAMTAVAMVSI